MNINDSKKYVYVLIGGILMGWIIDIKSILFMIFGLILWINEPIINNIKPRQILSRIIYILVMWYNNDVTKDNNIIEETTVRDDRIEEIRDDKIEEIRDDKIEEIIETDDKKILVLTEFKPLPPTYGYI